MDYRIPSLDLPELLEHINDAFFGLHEDWTFSYLNKAAEKLLFRDRQDLMGVNIWDAFPQAVGSTFYHQYHEAVNSQREVAFTEYYPPLQSWFFVKAYPTKNKGLLVFFNNINELKQAEAKLRQSEDTFRNLFEHMTIGVVYQNHEAEITAANPAAQQILGLSMDELSGRVSADPRWQALDEQGKNLPSEEHPAVMALKTGRQITGFHMQVFNPRMNSFRWLLVDSVPRFHDGEEKPFQVFTLFRDITERQQALTDREEMIHVIAHDLRNPVGSAIVLSDIIEDQWKKQPVRMPEEVSYLKKSLKRASQLMDDMIDAVRLEVGNAEMEMEKVAVSSFLNDLEHTQKSLVEAAGLHWELQDEAAGGSSIRAATHRLHQVFENLISNAIKFTPASGKIRLHTYTGEQKIHFALSDSGKGILPEDISHIFKKYWQPKSGRQGTGLGLYIVKRIIEAHQGHISVSSEPGKGSTFHIQLPLAD
jgi:PAS domain S-box-containing protein